MKDTRFWRIALFFGILCFCLCSAQPILASETTEEDGDWIYICYLVDDCPTVKMKPGYAMSNLWEPETVHGAKFLYWTTMRTDPMNEQYKVTKETVFYETTFLSAVTVNTEKELEESMKFAQEWDAGQGTQQETEAARDRYTVVFHLENGEDDWVYYYDKPTVVGKERYDRFVSEIEEKKGYHFVGFYTKPNGKGRK